MNTTNPTSALTGSATKPSLEKLETKLSGASLDEPCLDTPWRGEKAAFLSSSLSPNSSEKFVKMSTPGLGENDKPHSFVSKESPLGKIKLASHEEDEADDDEEEEIDEKGCKIKKNIRKKYFLTNDNMRLKLIDLVQNHNISIKQAAQFLSLNYSTANSIIRLYKKEGRIIKKNSGTTQPGEGNPLIDPLNPQTTFKLPMSGGLSSNVVTARTQATPVSTIHLVDPSRGTTTGGILQATPITNASSIGIPNGGLQTIQTQNGQLVTLANGTPIELSAANGIPTNGTISYTLHPVDNGGMNVVGGNTIIANPAALQGGTIRIGQDLSQANTATLIGAPSSGTAGTTFISGPFITSSNTTHHSFNASGVLNGSMPINLGTLSNGGNLIAGSPLMTSSGTTGQLQGATTSIPVTFTTQGNGQKNFNIVMGNNGQGTAMATAGNGYPQMSKITTMPRGGQQGTTMIAAQNLTPGVNPQLVQTMCVPANAIGSQVTTGGQGMQQQNHYHQQQLQGQQQRYHQQQHQQQYVTNGQTVTANGMVINSAVGNSGNGSQFSQFQNGGSLQ